MVDGRGGGEREDVTAVPTLETARLFLRPFTLADAPTVQEMAGDLRVSVTTLNIPHPYPEGLAREWIGTHAASAAEGGMYTFAIERKDDEALLGGITITITRQHERAEIGYWLGFSYWNQGYTTEAARCVVAFGFEELGLNRIQATHWPRNPASGRVMEKAGLLYEGTLRGYLLRKGSIEDTAIHALLRADWEKLSVNTNSW